MYRACKGRYVKKINNDKVPFHFARDVDNKSFKINFPKANIN